MLLHADTATSEGRVSLTVRYDLCFRRLARDSSVLGHMLGTVACGVPGEKPFRRNVHTSALARISLRKTSGDRGRHRGAGAGRPGRLEGVLRGDPDTRARTQRFPPAIAPRTFTVRFLDGQGGGMNRKSTTLIPGPGAGYPATVSAKLTRIVNVRPDLGFAPDRRIAAADSFDSAAQVLDDHVPLDLRRSLDDRSTFASRIHFSTGWSRMIPAPPKTCTASVVMLIAASAANAFA